MANVGLLVWGTQPSFNGFCILASLLLQRRSPEANQTLHNVWSSPGLLHYIYIFRGFCPLTESCHMQTSLCIQVLCSPILAVLLHGTPAVGISQTLWHGTRNGITKLSQRRHSAGQPSRWALAHILDLVTFLLHIWQKYIMKCNDTNCITLYNFN